MKSRSLTACFLSTAIVLALMPAVLSDDPPDWRGDPNTTFQDWTFDDDSNPAAPSGLVNPNGTPSADITVSEFGTYWWDNSDLSWSAVFGSAQGWWDIAEGSILLTVPNQGNANPGSFTSIQLQVTYWLDISEAPEVSVSPFAVQQGEKETTLVESGPAGGGWYSDLYRWNVSPSPYSLAITLVGPASSGSMIDRIIVDTLYVVPEPSSAACAMVLGAVAVW